MKRKFSDLFFWCIMGLLIGFVIGLIIGDKMGTESVRSGRYIPVIKKIKYKNGEPSDTTYKFIPK